MTTAAESTVTAPAQPAAQPAHPRTRSMESWRARKAVMASRGETTGSRVDEADVALSWWRTRAFLIREGSTPEQADALLDLIDRHAAAVQAEAVVR